MDLLIDIAIIACIGAFLFLVMRELAQSQKNSEPAKPNQVSKYTYVMQVRLAVPGSHPVQIKTFEANSLEYMQQALNNMAFWAIQDATVRKNGVLSHYMDETGVLREV